jgi:hypothetical protein
MNVWNGWVPAITSLVTALIVLGGTLYMEPHVAASMPASTRSR